MHSLAVLTVFFVLSHLPAAAQSSAGSGTAVAALGLLGVGSGDTAPSVGPSAAASAAPSPSLAAAPPDREPTYEERDALRWKVVRARDALKRAKDDIAHVDLFIPDNAPGGYWERYYRRKVQEGERYVQLARQEVRTADSYWRRFRRFMQTDVFTGELLGSNDLSIARSRLQSSEEDLASNRRALADLPDKYRRMVDRRKELVASIPRLERELEAAEAERRAMNARGFRVLPDDEVPSRR